MAKTDYISLQKLQQIASGTALMNGLVPVSREEISRMYYQNEKKLLPILKKCDAGTIWVDRYYVAYQLGDGDVRYTYISQHHLAEEVLAYRNASEERGVTMALPLDILHCFQIAKLEMQATGLPYWIAAPWSEKVLRKSKSEHK